MPETFIRFRTNIAKCVEGIDFLAQQQPGITQYYICKIFFFADKEHLLDWGRPISGDRMIAMAHGPVPSMVYDLVKDAGGEPDEVIDGLEERVRIERIGNKRMVHSLGNNEFPSLSRTDMDYLREAHRAYGHMSFQALREVSHRDPAYREAWEQPGAANEMDIRRWFEDQEWQDTNVVEDLEERAVLSFAVAAQ